MRRAILFLISLLLATTAQAASPLRSGVTYAEGRAEMVRRGFAPQGVSPKPWDYACRDAPKLCAAYPELIRCTPSGLYVCDFRYRRNTDGQIWTVIAKGGSPQSPELVVLEAKPDPPQLPISEAIPYPKARARLIRLGYSPVEVIRKPFAHTCREQPVLCRAYSELLSCTSNGRPLCDLLFRSRADGRLWKVIVEGEVLDVADLHRLQVLRTIPASALDIEGAVIAKASGRGHSPGP